MNRSLTLSLVMAVVMIGGALALKSAQTLHLLGAETAQRVVQVMIGLMVAIYGNYMPKTLGAWRSASAETRTQFALRFGGRLFMIAGLAFAAVGAFAPLAVANIAQFAIMGPATIIVLGLTAWLAWACIQDSRSGASR